MPIIYDFSLLLFVLTLLTGVIWGFDRLLLKPRRPKDAREPVLVEYAGSFFPIILIVLVVRSFLFEPFRIPSDSMMPTLLDGDFIFVNKFSYGIKLPVINQKIIDVGSPQRGDVIVFRKPSDPGTNYIKRLVGLPGDRVEIRGDAITVNGEVMGAKDLGPFTEDPCYRNFHQGTELLGSREHRIMYCPVETRRMPGCTSSRVYEECPADPTRPAALSGEPGREQVTVYVVPAGYYFFMGDNRDNSADSRYPELGYVPEANLVGKAVRIWLNIGLSPKAALGRIGQAIR